MQRFISSASVCLQVGELNIRRRLHIFLEPLVSTRLRLAPFSLSLSVVVSLDFYSESSTSSNVSCNFDENSLMNRRKREENKSTTVVCSR